MQNTHNFLTQEETIHHIKLAKQGNEQSKEILVEKNSPLIKSLIKRFLNKGIEFDDLYQIAVMGFLKAIKNFDLKFDVMFSTYVVPMVIGEIKRFMRDDGAIKVSRTIKSLNLKIKKYIEEFAKENFAMPTVAQIAQEFCIDQAEVVFVMDSAAMPMSIYTPIEEDGSNLFLIDRINSDDSYLKTLDNISLKEVISTLDSRDKQILLLRYYQDKTQSEIAKILNVSQVQVSRLENKLLEKLRDRMS